MRVFVVNLDRSIDRMESATRQLNALGVDFERWPAVDGALLSDEERKAAVGFRWWCATGRKIRVGELGCALSHIKLYRKMIDENIPLACILEDDVKLAACLPDVLKRSETYLTSDVPTVIQLSNWTDYESDKEEIRDSSQNNSTEAYVITQEAARRILKINMPIAVPCDHWQRFARLGNIRICNIYPTACLKNDFWFGSMSSEGESLVSQWPILKKSIHKIKRFLGKAIDEFLIRLGR